MKEQKNIDRLFQEKFKDFEVVPPAMAWQNIEAKLNKKEKKRRVIPFWLKATGIAASLVLGFFMFTFFNESNLFNSDIKTVEKENNNATFKKESEKNNFEKNKDSEILIVPNSGVVTDNNSLNEINKVASESEFINTKKQSQSTENKLVNTTKNHTITATEKVKINVNQSLVENKNLKENAETNAVFVTTIKSIEKEQESQLTNSSLEKLDPKTVTNNSLNQTKNNTNRSVVILETSNASSTQDSSIVAIISDEVSALEQLLKEKEVGKNAEEKEKGSKWGVSTNAAPVYFNSTTKGSSIDKQFAENSKSYISTLSYGIGVHYDLSNKISLRAGINSLALEYDTNDVSYTASLKQVPQDNMMLSRNANGENIVFLNKNAENAFVSDVANFTQENVGTLNQTTSYIEVPFEIGYKLLDTKFGVELIGGMSSLFLNRNSVSLLSNGMEMEIGKATNLNSVHFSSNVGIGFKYRFFKSFETNFNPMFKYQINTYTENVGNFKPYFIGLYSGLSYKF